MLLMIDAADAAELGNGAAGAKLSNRSGDT